MSAKLPLGALVQETRTKEPAVIVGYGQIPGNLENRESADVYLVEQVAPPAGTRGTVTEAWASVERAKVHVWRNFYKFQEAREIEHDGHKVVILDTFVPDEAEPDNKMHSLVCLDCEERFEAFVDEVTSFHTMAQDRGVPGWHCPGCDWETPPWGVAAWSTARDSWLAVHKVEAVAA
jgi:hypothetical protein